MLFQSAADRTLDSSGDDWPGVGRAPGADAFRRLVTRLPQASKIASVRESIMSVLYGPYVARGVVKTVDELGLQEAVPFLPIEAQATVQHLITARSGIHLAQGNENQDRLAPKRGAAYPGTRMQYNNWDFNAAGTAFEKPTRTTIYQALEAELSGSSGMQDFERAKQGKVPSPGSVDPEYVMRLSTRDLARVGLAIGLLAGTAGVATRIVLAGSRGGKAKKREEKAGPGPAEPNVMATRSGCKADCPRSSRTTFRAG